MNLYPLKLVNMKLLFALLFLSSCSLFLSGDNAPKSAKESLYTIHFNLTGWTFKPDKRSDYIYENNDGRILLSNSFCDEFQEQPLEQLAKKTFKSVSEFKSKVSEYTTLQNREAYRIEGTGLVDGVKVNLRLLNTRRDNCYFDFLAIIPEGRKENDSAFNEFLNKVNFK